MFERTMPALLIIDMQNDFVAQGAPIECPGAREIVAPIRGLLQIARASGVPVIFTQERHRAEMVDFGLELEYEEPIHCVEGTAGPEFYSLLRPEAGDFVIVKRRYSAFFATDLEILLKGLGVDTLVLTGVATDVCVRATAQDAQQLNYRVFVVPECVAGTSPARHDAALDNIAYIYGRMLNAEATADLLRSGGADRLSRDRASGQAVHGVPRQGNQQSAFGF